MHHIVTPGFVDRPRRSDCTAGQMDGEAGWWTTSGNIGLPPLARVMRVGRQQQKERAMDVIKGYVEVNDDVENETMRYIGELWTERQGNVLKSERNTYVL